jgi:hypothetical protein
MLKFFTTVYREALQPKRREGFFGGEQTRRFLSRQERVDQLNRWAIGEQGYENFVAGATLVRDSLHLSADQARLRSLISFPHLNMLL